MKKRTVVAISLIAIAIIIIMLFIATYSSVYRNPPFISLNQQEPPGQSESYWTLSVKDIVNANPSLDRILLVANNESGSERLNRSLDLMVPGIDYDGVTFIHNASYSVLNVGDSFLLAKSVFGLGSKLTLFQIYSNGVIIGLGFQMIH